MELFSLSILGKLRFSIDVEDDELDIVQAVMDLTNHHESAPEPIGFSWPEEEDRR